jgi:hypothetical protein
MRMTFHLLCLAAASCFLLITGCGRGGSGVDFGNYGYCGEGDCIDQGNPNLLRDLSGPDLAFPYPDFGGPDFGNHHHHDMGPDLSQVPDLAQPVPDLAQPVPDLAQPAPDMRSVQACTTCLSTSCSSQVDVCQADPNCARALSCVVSDGCFTFAGGSDSFASCVNGCVATEQLTLAQTVAVLNEVGALSSCTQDCVDVCGGN